MKNKTIYALGFFDGVHLGHQALLTECLRLAFEQGCEAAAITFDRHPQALFTDRPPVLINTTPDRIALLKRFRMDEVKTYPVTKETMGMPWEIFLTQLVEEGAAGFVCGEDFRFGHKGAGNAENLKAFCTEYNLPCSIVPEQTLDGVRISSTHIRKLLEAGEMEEAVRFLGHPHILRGEVMSGRQLGRTLGIPTANLWIPEGVAVPRHGVYACRAILKEGIYLAVTNIGNRPTVGGHRVTVEPWLLDFSGDLYGKALTLEFYAFLRPERKFDSLEALREEIQKNAAQTREIFEKT